MLEKYELSKKKEKRHMPSILGGITYDIFAKNTSFVRKIRALCERKTCAILGGISYAICAKNTTDSLTDEKYELCADEK